MTAATEEIAGKPYENLPDMKVSIDQLVEKLERQVKRYREMRTVEPRRHVEHNGDAGTGDAT